MTELDRKEKGSYLVSVPRHCKSIQLNQNYLRRDDQGPKTLCFRAQKSAYGERIKNILDDFDLNRRVYFTLVLILELNSFFPCDPVCLISPKSPIRIIRLDPAAAILDF